MVSISQASLEKLVHSPGSSSPSSSPLSSKSWDDPGSPTSKTWDDALLELDFGLQRICGSPSPSNSMNALNRFSQGSLPKLEVTIPECSASMSWPNGSSVLQGYKRTASSDPASPNVYNLAPGYTSDPRQLSPGQQVMGPVSPKSHPLFRRAVSQEPMLRSAAMAEHMPIRHPVKNRPSTTAHQSVLRSQSYSTGNPAKTRPVYVRQEETHLKLAEKLAKISGVDQPPGSPKCRKTTFDKDVLPLGSAVLRRESLKQGFRHKVSITGHNVNGLAVCVNKDHHLHVINLSSGSIIDEIELPRGIRIQHLLCFVIGDSLLIRERSKSLWACDSHLPIPQYLPILLDDDSDDVLKLTIKIPDYLRYEDLSVRIVDENKLVISRKRVSYPGVHGKPFEIALMLSELVENSGVEASLSSDHLLFVKVSFDGRRYSC